MRAIAAFIIALFIAQIALLPSQLPERPAHARSEGQDDSARVATGLSKPPPTLDSNLYDLWLTARQQGMASAQTLAGDMDMELEGDLVPIVVEARAGRVQEALRALKDYGGKTEIEYENLLQARLPIDMIMALARNPYVVTVRRPIRMEPPEIISQGVESIQADRWSDIGVTGQGVKVGIIDSFRNYEVLVGSELPPASNIVYRNFGPNPSVDNHGNAVAEIIHDVAPDALLYLAGTARTDPEVAAATDWLIEQGVDVILGELVTSLDGPGDGTGFVNSQVDKAAGADILWIAPAGNSAEHRWAGLWDDPDLDGTLNFTSSQDLNRFILNRAQNVQVFLTWDDAWGGACSDYDLLLFRLPGDGSPPIQVASSRDLQSCLPQHLPREWIRYQAPAGSYGIAIVRNFSPPPHKFDLSLSHLVSVYGLEYTVSAGSIRQPADNPRALSVGASQYACAPDAIEPYSSRGPTNDGRIKPDLAAPSHVSTASNGATPFIGTSAAAPHVAGAAALLMQANSGWTAIQLRQALESNTLDLGIFGRDGAYGAGLLTLKPPPGNLPSPSKAPISVARVWTTDSNEQTKANFRPGETIKFWAEMRNEGPEPVTIPSCWAYPGRLGFLRLVYNLVIPQGTSVFGPTTLAIPGGVLEGDYSFTVYAQDRRASVNFMVKNVILPSHSTLPSQSATSSPTPPPPVALVAGLNLIASPVDGPLPVVITGIAQQTISIFLFDAPSQTWSWFFPLSPNGVNTISSLIKGRIYFITVMSDITWLPPYSP